METEVAHEPLDRAARDVPAPESVVLAVEHDVHLPGTEDTEVVVVDLSDLLLEGLVAACPGGGLTLLAGVVGARSDLGACLAQGLADRLDSELILVLVDERAGHLEGRSSSAAKKADADFKIAFARRSSRTSFSSSVIRSLSAVVVPGRVPASVWA